MIMTRTRVCLDVRIFLKRTCRVIAVAPFARTRCVMLFETMMESYGMGWSMWLVQPTVDVDLQSAVLGVVVSWLEGKSQLDV